MERVMGELREMWDLMIDRVDIYDIIARDDLHMMLSLRFFCTCPQI
jgi:hypothetical protein